MFKGGISIPEQRITIEIDNDGKIKAKTNGFSGDTCLEELQELLEMEESPSIVNLTDDYYQKRTQTSKNIQYSERK